MAPRSGVIFDIDGTLVDTTYLHTAAWRRAFLDHDLDVSTVDIHRRIGMGSGLLLEELTGERRDDLKDSWRKHFEAMKPEIRAFPGAPELLRAVADSGAAVVLASSSEEEDVGDLLDALGVDDVLDVVTSSGDVDEAKPDPEVFEVAMGKAGLDAEHAVVVGDAVWDVEAAKRCGLPCVGVLTGGISEAELREAGAVAVYRTPRDLLDDLEDGPLAPFLGSTTPR
ncbi:MAG TPA: HAD family hydrolase [Acidimicrobiales bacterium]|nr:HAD family hydrolase [Acidimicrobiales bacterium]